MGFSVYIMAYARVKRSLMHILMAVENIQMVPFNTEVGCALCQ